MSELGERLSKLRRDKGMTQEELASHLQVTRQTVSSYENGKSEPDIAMLHKLSEALETEVSFLIDGKEPEEQEEKKQQDSKDRKKKIKLWLLQLAGMALILLAIRLAEPAIHRYVQDTFLLWPVFICKYMLYPLLFFLGRRSVSAACASAVSGFSSAVGKSLWLDTRNSFADTDRFCPACCFADCRVGI